MKSAIKRNRRLVLTIILTICMISGVSLSGVWAQSTADASYESSSEDAVEYVTVTYHPNGGGLGPVVDGPYPVGSMYTFPNSDALGIVMDNYKLICWAENQDGSGNVINPGDRIVLTESLEFYARWEFQGDYYYMLILNANTGTGSQVISGLAPGTSYTLQDASFYGIEKDYYEFTGWNSKADGSGVDYGKTASIVIGEENVTLYAQWAYKSTLYYSVSYTAGGGFGGPTTDRGLAAGEEYIVKGPEDVGISFSILKFMHWVNAHDPAETFMEGDVIEALDRNIVLDAVWGL